MNPSNQPIWIRFFIYSTGGLLLAAALERFIIALGTAPVLDLPDPLLEIPLRYAVLGVGILELGVALVCRFGKSVTWFSVLATWLATNWAVYRIGLLCMGLHVQCTCVGRVTDPFQLPRGDASYILACLPICLVLGSYGTIYWLMRHRPRRLASGFLNSSREACESHVEVLASGVGQKIASPRGLNPVTVQHAL